MAGVVTDDLTNPIHFAKVNLVDYEQQLLQGIAFYNNATLLRLYAWPFLPSSKQEREVKNKALTTNRESDGMTCKCILTFFRKSG